MSNYKVKVNNEVESREVQELFFELGYGFEGCRNKTVQTFEYVNPFYFFAYSDLDLTVSGDNSVFSLKTSHKELTIPQLKDLVVLKRNSIDDATHTCGTKKYYLTHNEFYEYMDDKWVNVDEYVDGCIFDPITNPLKEYLVPQDNGKYALIKANEKRVSDWIEVHDGMDFAYSNGFNIHFTNFKMDHCDSIVVWQRHTQPEALPFVDDEPKLNTPMAEAERGFKREQCLSNAKNKGLLEARDVEPVVVDLSDIKKTFSSEPKSLNDTYAEIEQIRQDSVNNPQHYNKGGIECIDAIEASMTLEAFKGYLKGNVQKYMWRYEHKGGKESLQKAQWYLNKLISKL